MMHANATATGRCVFVAVVVVATLMSGPHAHAQPGWVLSHQKISDTQGEFTGILSNSDSFGRSLASLGDLDGDGVGDLAVGAMRDDDGGSDRGAVWILFLNSDGTVRAHQKISDTQGDFTGNLDNSDFFGQSVASLGDLDSDGVGDLAVGALRDDDGGFNHGAVWVLFLNTNGTVKSHQKISDTQGGFTGDLDDSDAFGASVASLGDHDGDGVTDLAVGAMGDADGGSSRGATWILFLQADGTVKSHQKISDLKGGFTGDLDNNDVFGAAMASLGDLNDDDVGDLVVGAPGDDDGGDARGAVWILFLNPDGTVSTHQKISDTQGGITDILDNADGFGRTATSLGDLDGDGVGDLAVGAPGDDHGGNDRGAVWMLFLNRDGTVRTYQKISDLSGGFTGDLDNADGFGRTVTSLGDLNGDGVTDLAAAAPGDDDGGGDRGAVWMLFLDGVPIPIAADLIACSITFGSTDNSPCDVANLVENDNVDQILRSQFGFSAFERNVTEIVINGIGAGAATIVSIDTRDGSNTTNVVAKIKARNYKTNFFDDIAQYDVSFPGNDTSHSTPVNSPDFIKFNGEIEIYLRYVAPAAFSAQGFTVGLDHVAVIVE